MLHNKGDTLSPNNAKGKPKEVGIREIDKGDVELQELRQIYSPPATTKVRNARSKEQKVLSKPNEEAGLKDSVVVAMQMMNVTNADGGQKWAGHVVNSNSLIPKHINNQLVANENNTKDPETLRGTGRDMDDESTTQNFQKVARQGDLSPRHMDHRKSVGKREEKATQGYCQCTTFRGSNKKNHL